MHIEPPNEQQWSWSDRVDVCACVCVCQRLLYCKWQMAAKLAATVICATTGALKLAVNSKQECFVPYNEWQCANTDSAVVEICDGALSTQFSIFVYTDCEILWRFRSKFSFCCFCLCDLFWCQNRSVIATKKPHLIYLLQRKSSMGDASDWKTKCTLCRLMCIILSCVIWIIRVFVKSWKSDEMSGILRWEIDRLVLGELTR